MEKSPENSAIEQNAELDSATEGKKPTRHDKPYVVTENMIRLRRKFDFSTRPRPKALAIIHPETRTVLYPGIEKITEDKTEESESSNEDDSAHADHQYVGVFQSMQQQQINQVSGNQPLPDQSPLNLQYDPRYQFHASCQNFLPYYDLPFNKQREP